MFEWKPSFCKKLREFDPFSIRLSVYHMWQTCLCGHDKNPWNGKWIEFRPILLQLTKSTLNRIYMESGISVYHLISNQKILSMAALSRPGSNQCSRQWRWCEIWNQGDQLKILLQCHFIHLEHMQNIEVSNH